MMQRMPSHPTGAQYEIRHGDQVAVVTELGATLRSYDVAGQAVVDGFAVDARPDGGRGQILAPWPNRIRDGRYTFAGADHQLPITEVAHHNAIHGLVRWAGWSLVEHAERSVRLATTVWPQPGYPFLVRLMSTYLLDDDGLTVTIHARNDGSTAAPYGVGQHPYVTLGVPVDDIELTVPARRRLLTDDRGNPVGAEDVAGTTYDFMVARRVGGLVLDTAYGELVRDGDGRAAVRVAHADRAVEVWLGTGAEHLQVFSGDTLPDPRRRRRGVAVEPMSCPPGAFVSGTGLVTLGSGEHHEITWGVRSA